ncbi:MAG TPA: glutamine--tRNA ligase/YqeY domain fusion protein [Planctomycetota bacterium]|nr:glutamine--tRNA ligase/YqeY domain fusion protein [Planctomycetota bacterium]
MTTSERPSESTGERAEPVDFVRQKVAADVAAGTDGGRVHTRFPPEPNGWLHLGHAKSICLNFGLAADFGGVCNLRFDDTNPTRESVEYVDSIQRDVRWLGFDWGDRLFYASDYFERLYELAVQLVRQGDAYVCDLDGEAMRRLRGSLTEPGTDSPGRSRDVAESLSLLERMRAGEFPDGAYTLRAKIDMASPNVLLRDPVMYRIMHAHHHRTGDAWCIYPTYDWAHGQSDALEGITHSVCTLEFENHRPLYDWFLDRLALAPRPRQTEFARLSLSYTVLSKRKLLELVEGGHVGGWDDPRMPTLAGVRRLGYTPEALRAFCEGIGVTRVNGVVDVQVLQNALREDLNRRAPRRMAVLDPLELVIENWPAGQVDMVDAVNNPEDESAGKRKLPFSGRLFIERDDFRTEAPSKYFRLKPGGEVRLRYGYYVTATGFDTDPATGAVTRVRCTYDPETRGGDSPDGRKVKGTIHWVCAEHAVEREVRLYDHLFAVPAPGEVEEGQDWKEGLNPESLRVVTGKLEPDLADAPPGSHWQFERSGYYCVDSVDSRPGAPVFNRSVALRDSWAKIERKQ